MVLLPGTPWGRVWGGSWPGSACSGSPLAREPPGGSSEDWGWAGRSPGATGRHRASTAPCCTCTREPKTRVGARTRFQSDTGYVHTGLINLRLWAESVVGSGSGLFLLLTATLAVTAALDKLLAVVALAKSLVVIVLAKLLAVVALT